MPINEVEKNQLIKLGNRIRELRNEKGLTQKELANLIDKDRQSIQRLETGNINPTYLYLKEVCKGLGMELHHILDF